MTKCVVPYTNRIAEYAFIACFLILSFFPLNANLIKPLCLLVAIGSWIARVKTGERIQFTKTSLNIPKSFFVTLFNEEALTHANV